MSLEFSNKTKKVIDKIIARYPQKEAALLPVLHVIQKEFGQISAEEEILAASLLDISQIKVREVVTFYTMFNRKAVGKYHIQVCSNLTCSLMGADNIIDYIEEKLGIPIKHFAYVSDICLDCSQSKKHDYRITCDLSCTCKLYPESNNGETICVPVEGEV